MTDVSTRSPDGSTPPSQKPGRMTAVMRAVAQTTSGPKVLRIAHLIGGKIVEERVIKDRGPVSIGAAEQNTFVVPSVKTSVKLFDLVNGDYHLALIEGVSGRVVLRTGPTDLATLRGVPRVRLEDESRGKIAVGESTFLFQLVPPPPVQPKPRLPASVRSGLGDNVDWAMTVIGAMSFLMHFGAIGSFYSDWGDKIIDDQASVGGLVERIHRLPPPPVEPVPEQATPDDTKAPDKAPEKTVKNDAPRRTDRAETREAKNDGPPGKQPMTKSQAAALMAQLDRSDVATVGALTNTRASTDGVLKEGNVPTDRLDGLVASEGGVGHTGPGGLKMNGPGTGPMVPGTGQNGLSQMGSKSGADGTTKTSGTQQTVAGPVARMDGGGKVTVGKVSGAESTLAGARGRVRACYQSGLSSNGDMEGRVTFTISISGTGAISSVATTPSGTISGGVNGCIQGVLRGLRFDPPEGGTGATLSGSYSFINANKGK